MSWSKVQALSFNVLKRALDFPCGNFAERHSFRGVSKGSRKSTETVLFHKSSHTRKLGEITIFTQWYAWSKNVQGNRL